MKRAFSLVELSIVLVILGLLVGGILSGQSLIRAAEIRSFGTDTSKYVTAVWTFKDKYFALPGDMSNATKFWGTQSSTPATCQTTASTTALTCDGDGDGYVCSTGGAFCYEMHRFWQHLANAGLIEGTFTGIGTYSATGGTVAGINGPRMRLAGVTLQSRNYGQKTSDPDLYDGNYNHSFIAGKTLNGNSDPVDPFLKPEEAWNLDTKYDDGKPALGKWRTWKYGSPSSYIATSINCADSATIATAQYNFTNQTIGCGLFVTWQ